MAVLRVAWDISVPHCPESASDDQRRTAGQCCCPTCKERQDQDAAGYRSQTACRQALHPAVDTSFNRVTVDGDSSTNDTCLLLANGAAAEGTGAGWIEPGSQAYAEAAAAIKLVCTTLARAMAADGEGATTSPLL